MFVTFEGIEGSGKGTMLEYTTRWLVDMGLAPLLTREPGGSRLGQPLRSILLDSQNTFITPRAELFMYLADRAQHVEEIIRPALVAGKMVISDRYADSTIVYQGYGRGLDPEKLYLLNDEAVAGLWPELTVLLDIEPEDGLARAKKRNQQCGMSEKEGRFEAEVLDFHHKIRRGYRLWAQKNPERIKIVDASGTPEEVFARVQSCLMALTVISERLL